jgi:hypothetical protein
MAVQRWLALQAARCLGAIASGVLRRALRQAHRQLMALDDRTLADLGLFRTELTPLLMALAGTPTAASSQFPRYRPRMGA